MTYFPLADAFVGKLEVMSVVVGLDGLVHRLYDDCVFPNASSLTLCGHPVRGLFRDKSTHVTCLHCVAGASLGCR